jgi:hypothetical protein
MTESPTERFLRVLTHPTQIIRRSDVVRAEQAEVRRISPRLSTGLLVAAAVLSGVGIGIAVFGVLIRVPWILLLGFVLLSAGMASASLEGLLLPERDESGMWAMIKKAVHR